MTKENKYIPGHPEFIKEAERLGLTGYQYMRKLVEKGILPDPADVERKVYGKEYRDNLAREKGYKDRKEYDVERMREMRWNNGVCSPFSENEDCTDYIGISIGEVIAEAILIEIFGGIEKRMPNKFSGYDYIVKGGYSVDIKTAILNKGLNNLKFRINHNKIADYFLLLGIDDSNDLYLIHVWLIKKDEIIRKNKFYDRDMFTVTNRQYHLEEFEKYDHIHKLKCLEYVQNKLKKLKNI